MKTYRFLLVAFIATGVFTACNNELAVEQSIKQGAEVSFRLQGGMPEEITTRALATTVDNLEAFVVYGTDDLLSLVPDLIFDGVTVAREFDSSPPKFTYAPKRYYSEGASNAGFFAFSPVSANVSNVDVTNFMTGASFEYTVPAPDTSPFADPAAPVGSGDAVQEDLLVALTVVAPTAAPVSLDFEHALSRVFVTASNAAPDPIIIKGLKLLDLATTGTLDVTLAGWGWTPDYAVKGDYTYVLAQSGVVVPGTPVTSPPTTPTKLFVTSTEQGMMILPQETSHASNNGIYAAGDFALEITYDISNLQNQTKYVVLQDGFEFEAGWQYRINITFDEFLAIEFDVDVFPFEDTIEVTYP